MSELVTLVFEDSFGEDLKVYPVTGYGFDVRYVDIKLDRLHSLKLALLPDGTVSVVKQIVEGYRGRIPNVVRWKKFKSLCDEFQSLCPGGRNW